MNFLKLSDLREILRQLANAEISFSRATEIINEKAYEFYQLLSTQIKKATTSSEALKIEEKYEGKPHGWIQWKGTNVCMDVHCKCGNHFHIDDYFCYHVRCKKCNTVYSCNGHIELIEIEQTINIDPITSTITEEHL